MLLVPFRSHINDSAMKLVDSLPQTNESAILPAQIAYTCIAIASSGIACTDL